MKSPVEVLLSFLWVFLFCLYFRIIRKTGFEFDQEDQRERMHGRMKVDVMKGGIYRGE